MLAWVSVGDGELPERANPDNEVRAGLLRALLISANSPLHDKGLRLRGAWISGSLDLQGSTFDRDITLSFCHLTDPILLVNTQLHGLHLSSVELPGITAENAKFSGSVFIRADSEIT